MFIFCLILIFYSSFFINGSKIVVGQLNVDMIEVIELLNGDDIIALENPDEISTLLSCIDKEIVVKTGSYDWLAAGGCGGFHWNKDFRMKFIGRGKETTIHFYNCDAPHQHAIEKDFIRWTVSPQAKLFYLIVGKSFLLGGYDLQNLSDNLTKFTDIECVY